MTQISGKLRFPMAQEKLCPGVAQRFQRGDECFLIEVRL